MNRVEVTRSQARVIIGLAKGQNLSEIARDHNVTHQRMYNVLHGALARGIDLAEDVGILTRAEARSARDHPHALKENSEYLRWFAEVLRGPLAVIRVTSTTTQTVIDTAYPAVYRAPSQRSEIENAAIKALFEALRPSSMEYPGM